MTQKAELSIADCIKRLSGKGKVQTMGAKVKAVDAGKGMCTVVIDILDLEFDDIRLTAFESEDVKKCLLIIPKVNSYVLIGRIEGSDAWYLQQTTEVDEIHLAGKKYKSVNGETLQTQLNKLQAKVDLIINAITSSAVTTGDGGLAFKSNMAAVLSAAIDADFSQILNDKILHGD